MNCRDAQRLLSMARDGFLAARDETALAAHLRNCSGCRQFRDALVSFGGRARAVGEWQPAPVRGIRDRALERWSAEQEATAASRRTRLFLPALSRPVGLSLVGGLAIVLLAATILVARYHGNRDRSREIAMGNTFPTCVTSPVPRPANATGSPAPSTDPHGAPAATAGANGAHPAPKPETPRRSAPRRQRRRSRVRKHRHR
jgi:hypothetical protein